MKKNKKVFIAIILLCFVGILIYSINSQAPRGDTVESQEKILNRALQGGKNWTIYNAAYIDNYQISGAYSTNGKSAIVVFEKMDNGNSKLVLSTTENNDSIIVSGMIINQEWYDLIWFNGAQTEYAEITYTIPGEEKKTIRFDTSQMGVIYTPAVAETYSWNVIYHDEYGNTYKRP